MQCNISLTSFDDNTDTDLAEPTSAAAVAQELPKVEEKESHSSVADTSVSLSLILSQRKIAHEMKKTNT